MRRLILVKHSLPRIDPARPASEWHLSQEGRRRCALLARQLATHRPSVVVSSLEPKAIQTAEIVATRLGIPSEIAPNLHEHDRRNVLHLTASEFRAGVDAMFANRDKFIFGLETANHAQRRFAQAVSSVVAKHANRDVVIVAHGTVISLLVARHNAVDARALWQRLGLPSFVVVLLPELRLVEVVENVAEGTGSAPGQPPGRRRTD